jgi:hypothetical protein
MRPPIPMTAPPMRGHHIQWRSAAGTNPRRRKPWPSEARMPGRPRCPGQRIRAGSTAAADGASRAGIEPRCRATTNARSRPRWMRPPPARSCGASIQTATVLPRAVLPRSECRKWGLRDARGVSLPFTAVRSVQRGCRAPGGTYGAAASGAAGGQGLSGTRGSDRWRARRAPQSQAPRCCRTGGPTYGSRSDTTASR